jgi:SAM-dependent methyltransferase
LERIEFTHGSMLDLPTLGLEPFDYINCCGVLHHLEDPGAGLDSLLWVMAADGALGLMLYGKVGRTGVYQLQDLLRRLAGEGLTSEANVVAAKGVLAQLPATNWYQHSKAWLSDIEEFGDSGIYDLLLHSQDRATPYLISMNGLLMTKIYISV